MARAMRAPQSNGVAPAFPVDREAWEISQYDSIMEIRDRVIAGTHPRLKMLTSMALATSKPLDKALPALHGVDMPTSASQGGSQLPPHPPSTHSFNTPTNHPPTVGIDPIFLTKSDVLLKAETQQKRQRLERALADQVKEKQATSKQRFFDQEDLPEFNVTEVLKKAQELVKPVRFAENVGANGNASASDSFDENTFYSSQMNDSTPESAGKPEQPRKAPLPQNCKFFLRGDTCPYGEHCIYTHNPALRRGGQGQSDPKEQVQHHDIDLQGPPSAPRVDPNQPVKKNVAAEPPSQAERIAQLEAELSALKAGPPTSTGRPSDINTKNIQDNREQEEEPVYSPPDAIPPRPDNTIANRNRDARHQRRNRARERGANSPVINEGRVVRNHITSPVAPQPARVSPLAVAKVPPMSQAQRHQRRLDDTMYDSTDSRSAAQRSNGQPPLSNPRKRRRDRDSGESYRNVIARREPLSPEIRIKEEPVSPPPFAEPVESWNPRRQPVQQGPIYVDDVSPRYRTQDNVVYRSNVINRPAPRYVLDDYREAAASPFEPGTRRVVSSRQVPAPLTEVERYASPHPPPARAASQVYLPRREQEIPRQYRTSIQPEPLPYADPDLAPSPRFREIPATMAPPPRRIVVDQHGNQFYEQEVVSAPRPRQSSMIAAPPSRRVAADQPSQMEGPRYSMSRIQQPTNGAVEPMYSEKRPTPPLHRPLPHSYEYFFRGQDRQPVDHDAERLYGNDQQVRQTNDGVRLVRYAPPGLDGRYEQELRPSGGGVVSRVASVAPAERISRVQSVHPADGRRVVSLAGGEMVQQGGGGGGRQMSLRPSDDAYVRQPLEYAPVRTQYYPRPADDRG
ncbi:MAG: hypothetical protein Q9220_006320 [cf. Caloplaca sp. 1 TL-2023]